MKRHRPRRKFRQDPHKSAPTFGEEPNGFESLTRYQQKTVLQKLISKIAVLPHWKYLILFPLSILSSIKIKSLLLVGYHAMGGQGSASLICELRVIKIESTNYILMDPTVIQFPDEILGCKEFEVRNLDKDKKAQVIGLPS